MVYLRRCAPSFVDFSSGGTERRIHFDEMLQTNMATGKKRQIRIRVDTPASWRLSSEKLVLQSDASSVYVKEYDGAVWQALSKLLSETAHSHQMGNGQSACSIMRSVKVTNIWRIENFTLWQRYQLKVRQMREEHSRQALFVHDLPCLIGTNAQEQQANVDCLLGPSHRQTGINEKLLLHGTAWKTVDDRYLVVRLRSSSNETCHVWQRRILCITIVQGSSVHVSAPQDCLRVHPKAILDRCTSCFGRAILHGPSA